MSSFPVIDLAAFERAGEEKKRQMGREVDLICRASGFLAVRNHGVPDEVIDHVWSEAHAFFDLPAAEKNKSRAPYPGYPYGYLGPGTEVLAKSKGVVSPPDLKESFNGVPLAVPLPSCLAPGEVPKYEPVLSKPYLMGKFKKTVM